MVLLLPSVLLQRWLDFLPLNPPYFSDQVTCFPTAVSCLAQLPSSPGSTAASGNTDKALAPSSSALSPPQRPIQAQAVLPSLPVVGGAGPPGTGLWHLPQVTGWVEALAVSMPET